MTKRDLSKHVWKFQEGLLVVLCNEVVESNGSVFWGQKPAGVSVDTDVIVTGPDLKPKLVIMITHSSSDDIGLKKFWRNINELFDLKAAYPECVIANVSYQSGTPPIAEQATRALYDIVLSLDQSSELMDLNERSYSFVETHLLNADRQTVTQVVSDWVIGCTAGDKKAVSTLRSWLRNALTLAPKSPIWEKSLTPIQCAFASSTAALHSGFRRSLAKFSLLSDESLSALRDGQDSKVKACNPELLALNMVTPIVGGFRVTDEDLLTTIKTLGLKSISDIRSRAEHEMEVLPRLRGQLAQVACLDKYIDWIHSEWHSVTEKETLLMMLNQCFISPSSIGPKTGMVPDWHWLLDLLIYLIKHSGESRHSYSLSKLAEDIGATGVINRNDRLQISYYIERRKGLAPQVVDAIAASVSNRLKAQVAPRSLLANGSAITQMRADGVMERIMGAQEFEPLYWLLETALQDAGLEYRLDKSVLTFISDLHPRRPGTCKVAFVGGESVDSCILAIHCRTAHDGATDKRKELCGRGRALSSRYVNGVSCSQLHGKLALLLDGDFREKDIELLSLAGWSRIYSVRDMPKLIEDCMSMKGERCNG